MVPGARDSLAFEALADPTRREILQVLAGGEDVTAGEIAARVSSVGRTAVSSHLRVLRMSGLVSERRDGRFRRYSLDPGPAAEVVEFLTGLYRTSLADLKTAAEDASAQG